MHGNGAQVDLDALIGAWRGAFTSAQSALNAASSDHDLGGAELKRYTRRLTDERTSTAALLSLLAHDLHSQRPGLVRVLSSPRETRHLLGLPSGIDGCVFNVDGVLIASVAIHVAAWKRVFDTFLRHWIDRGGATIPAFSRRFDYPKLIHGKSRLDATRDFLASRGISLPEGSPRDAPGADTVHGLANAKREALERIVDETGVSAYAGARLYLELARDAHIPCAVVSGSTTTMQLLEHAGLSDLIAYCVDGTIAREQRLARKPAPDMLVAACRRLGVEPSRAAAFETTEDGVHAGRRAEFAVVVAVEQEGNGRALRASGADLVVTDLGQILERELV